MVCYDFSLITSKEIVVSIFKKGKRCQGLIAEEPVLSVVTNLIELRKKMGYIGFVVDGEQITSGVSDTFAGDKKVKNGWKDVYEPALKKECKRASAKYSRRKGKEIVNNERTAIYE